MSETEARHHGCPHECTACDENVAEFLGIPTRAEQDAAYRQRLADEAVAKLVVWHRAQADVYDAKLAKLAEERRRIWGQERRRHRAWGLEEDMSKNLIHGIPDDEWYLAQAVAEVRARALGFSSGRRGVEENENDEWEPDPSQRVCVLGALTLVRQKWVKRSALLGAAQGNDGVEEEKHERFFKCERFFTMGAAFREEIVVAYDNEGWS